MRRHEPMPLEERLALEVQEFLASDRRQWMLSGQEYYDCGDTAITRRVLGHVENGRLIPDDSFPNNKLSHCFLHNMVDDKLAYLLSKPYTLRCDDPDLLASLQAVLGAEFGYTLSELGYEASNKGIGWLHVYLDEEGRFCTEVVPSEQCLPLWADDAHRRLDGMLRVYELVQYEGRVRTTRLCVDCYTDREVTAYVLENGRLYEAVDLGENPTQPHFVRDGRAEGWGMVPFVPFRNNRSERCDLTFVKSLIDEYDKCRSDNANFLEELRRFYWVLKGYSGTDLTEFRRNLNWYGVIRVDDPEEGGADVISPPVDLSGFRDHFEQLRRDILECGQAVNRNINSLGSAPSGVALRFLYSSLDLKCNHLEVEFAHSFRWLLRFVRKYLAMTGEPVSDGDVTLIFNRDVAVNESEAIDCCRASAELLSRRTVLEQHPWVQDVESELERLRAEAASAESGAAERDGAPGAAGQAAGDAGASGDGADTGGASPAADGAETNGGKEETA